MGGIMEFAWNTQKNKMSDIKGKEMEQEREGKISNPDINHDKTHLNYDLVESELNLYQRVKERVEQVRSVSRIQKNSVVDYSNIITVSKDQYEEWGLDKSKRYLQEVYNYFCQEFGKENVVSAKVHLDETTPHMHLHFVPVNQENGKLQARKLMTPARINKIHTNAPKYLQEKGFDVVRGEGKTERSLEIHQYKAEKIKEQINMLKDKLEALEGQYEAFKDIESTIEELDSIEVKKGLIGDYKTMKGSEHDKVIGMAKKGVHLEVENGVLKKENKELKEIIERINKREYNTRQDSYRLRGERNKYKEKLENTMNIINSMRPEFKDEFIKCKKEIENPIKNIIKSQDLEL